MWSDIFFPGNPERRERLIRKNQELIDLMKGNFRATNQLIETLKKHLHLSFSPIALNEKATVKENCEVIVERIHEIQAVVEKIDTHLKEKLEPALYEKLLGLSLSDGEHQHVSGVLTATFSSIAAFSCCSILVVGWLINCGTFLTNITFAISKIAIGAAGTVVFGLIIGIDMIVEAILGSIERDKLERALEDYEKTLDEFRPASEAYQDSLIYVRVQIDMMK